MISWALAPDQFSPDNKTEMRAEFGMWSTAFVVWNNGREAGGEMNYQKPFVFFAALVMTGAGAGVLAPVAGAAMVRSAGAHMQAVAGLRHDAQVRGEPAQELLLLEPETAPSEGDGEKGRSPGGFKPVPVSDTLTTSVVSQLAFATQACQALTVAYRTDCLAKELEVLVDALPAAGAYAEARDALSKAAQELGTLSRQNRDTSQPRLKVTVKADPQTRRRPIAAIRPDAIERTNAKALAVLEDTTTVLLRSAAGNCGVAIHYQRIAQALGSTKLLLRS